MSNNILEDVNIFNVVPIIVSVFILYKVFKFIYVKTKEKKYQKRLSQSGVRDIDQMDGLQFEMYLKALFKELGYKIEVTKGSNDFGADLIIKDHRKKIVVQAKRYKYKSNVSIDAVQQIYAAMPYHKANEAWIITNSFYTNSAKQLAKSCHVTLLNRYDLIDYIQKIKPSVKPNHIKQTVQPEKRKCPECNGTLVPRHSKSGNQFLGCSNYPTCKHTESVAN